MQRANKKSKTIIVAIYFPPPKLHQPTKIIVNSTLLIFTLTKTDEMGCACIGIDDCLIATPAFIYDA